MKINPSTMASALSRYENAVRKEKASPTIQAEKDKMEFSENAKIYNRLMKAALSEENIDIERLHGIMNRMAAGVRDISVNTIVDDMLAVK